MVSDVSASISIANVVEESSVKRKLYGVSVVGVILIGG